MGFISVTLVEEGETLRFRVTDNGAGMDAEALRALNESIAAGIEEEAKDGRQKFASFGLSSIHRRLQLLYGEAFGITVESRPDAFTTVTVLIPKITFLTETTTEERRIDVDEKKDSDH